MQILTIVALNLFLFLRTTPFLLVADDLAWYRKRSTTPWRKWKEVKSLNDLKGYIFNRFYGGFSFGTNNIFKPFKLFGKERHINAVHIDHLFTTALHTTACVMIYLAFGSNQVSFWAAVLYSCNPLNNQTSIWLNGRRYIINIMLVLGMIMVSKVPFGWAYAGVLYYVTSIYHVTAFFAPVLLVYKYPWLLAGIPIFVLYKGPVILDKVIARFKIVHDADHVVFTPKRLIIVVKNYGHFFWKMFFPGLCTFTYPMLHFWGQTKEGNKDGYAFNWHFLRGILALAVSVGGLWYFIAHSSPQMACFWAFMCLSLLQWCSIVAIVQDLADRYANIGLVFGCLFLSYFVHLWGGQYAVPILVGFSCYYVPMLLTVMRMYHSEGTRWAYQRYYFPHLPNPLKFENEWLVKDQKNPMRALVLIQEHLRYGAKDFDILFQAAVCHLFVGDKDGAKKYAKLASENYHIGKEVHEAKMIENFLKGSEAPVVGVPSGAVSRQVRRADARKKK